jgi:hypothetical protein
VSGQTLVSGALAALGLLVCGALAALGRPVPDVLVLGTTAAIAGYFGAVHPGQGASHDPGQDTPTGRHAGTP